MMNLINDPWIPVIREDGRREKIAPWQIAETANPVMEIAAPRADFQGALYQFLIGLLQTAYSPEDLDEWQDRWTAMGAELLKGIFAPFSIAFELFNTDGPAFLQDFSMAEGEFKPLSGLLIEAPGGKTLKDNLDHFIHGQQNFAACPCCSAVALFTLQTNAPSGGVGHRVGLRGGGPLTTLVMPQNNFSSLWQKLWLNILTQDEFNAAAEPNMPAVFPWLAPSRLSDKSGEPTLPQDVSLLQMYWGMPRRIRLHIDSFSTGECSLCGERSEQLVSGYTTKNYGVNYEGPWVHPLTPYRIDSQHKQPPLSLKGQQGGLGYRHWLGLNWQDEDNGDTAAMVVRAFNADKALQLANLGEIYGAIARLWCFGYDMDNMKARCWYEHQMPVVAVPDAYRDGFLDFVSKLIRTAKDVVYLLRTHIKAAWFERPGDVKGDTSMIDASFWQATEASFYQQLQILAEQPASTRFMPPDIASNWLKTLQHAAFSQFDQWALEGEVEDMDMKRIITARNMLKRKLYTNKHIKDLKQFASAQTMEVA